MRIGFNFIPYSPGRHGGAEVYLRSIVFALSESDITSEVVVFVTPRGKGYYIPPDSRSREVVVPVKPFSRSHRVFLEQTLLPFLVSKHRLDCLISNYTVPVLAPCANVVVVHDMLYRRYPEAIERSKLLYWRLMIPVSIHRSRAVIAVSHFSANEIKSYFGNVAGKLFVTGEGIRPSLKKLAPEKWTQDKVGGKFILSVATFGKHKNLDTLLRGFAAISEEFPDIALVLVGAARTSDAQESKKSLLDMAYRLGISNRLIFTGHVTEHELAALYQSALACVIPSFYEGFGLPVLEAQYFGCPVLCSNAASLPEVAGDAALTFDPGSSSAIADALREIIADPSLRRVLRSKGYRNVRRFSWESAAKRMMDAIEFAVDQNVSSGKRMSP